MPEPGPPSARRAARCALLPFCLLLLVAAGPCGGPPFHQRGRPLFVSPQANPLALSADGSVLYVVNTTAGTLSVLDVATPGSPAVLAEIDVGSDPVGVAVRPKVVPGDPLEDELVLVANHVSDSVSVVSRQRLDVIQTVQALDAEGVSLTNEPVGVAFASPFRAFVTLDEPNEVLVLDLDVPGRATIHGTRIAIPAQAPRALAVGGGRLFVAAFESNNQTEFPTCAPDDPRGLNPLDPFDMGCEFGFDLTTAVALNRVHRGGRVIRDGDVPDRDLFVFDASTLAPVDTLSGVSTLLYGLVSNAAGTRLYLTSTDARNDRNGLGELANRMFDNRLSTIDCSGACTSYDPPIHTDLDAAAGVPAPTPYGIALSGDEQTLAVTVAGSDGVAGIPADPGVDLPGLLLLDGTGGFRSRIALGAIPQGVALASDGAGAATFAYVLNTVDATLSVIDVSTPATPTVSATFPLPDPTPAAVKRGRIAFSAARASSGGTFSCESCHPNGNTDQLLWTINSVLHPDDGPDGSGVIAEPRTTQAIRGLRDTLPLHWDGALGDPVPGATLPGDAAPDCDPIANGEQSCFRHLVDASLSGVMCDPAGGCAVGPSGLPGALDDALRDDLARFLMSVAHPPPPARRASGSLSTDARSGAREFFTADNGLGLNPVETCGKPELGCHSLPLLTGTNNHLSGGDAPSLRGIWDRTVLFSSGMFASEEVLAFMQSCALGTGPQPWCGEFNQTVGPSGDLFWDPAVGMTERGSLVAGANVGDRFLVGLDAEDLWTFLSEMSVGLHPLTGRQVELDATSAVAPSTIAEMDALEVAGGERRLVIYADNAVLGAHAFDPAAGSWRPLAGGALQSGQDLRDWVVAEGEVVRLTAWAARAVVPDGAPQPTIAPDPPIGPVDAANISRPPAGGAATIAVSHSGVFANALVLVDGAPCPTCTLAVLSGAGTTGLADVTLDPVPAVGPHMLQLANPNGMETNELLFVAE